MIARPVAPLLRHNPISKRNPYHERLELIERDVLAFQSEALLAYLWFKMKPCPHRKLTQHASLDRTYKLAIETDRSLI
jgi:hypothetical protein